VLAAEAPFAIQARALPDALAGRDVLGRAQTGSGKTLAFGLPLLTRLAAAPGPRREKTPRGLVLVPTRELAQQVADVLVPLGRAVGVSIATVYGGVSISAQIARVRHADIVVATPGRLIDLLERHACTLSGIQVSVLDEADHMADLGFLPAVTQIIDQTPADGQRMLFSATLDRNVGQLVTRYTTDAALHAVTSSTDSGPAEHRVLVLSAQDKVAVAAEIASRPGRTLFFVRTKHGADRLVKQLTRAGVEAAAIHGDRNQNQRQRALDAFAAGYPRVLVATDVAARGIHVDDVDLVVQFDPPNDHKDYLHRSGRTARAGSYLKYVEHQNLPLHIDNREFGDLTVLVCVRYVPPASGEASATMVASPAGVSRFRLRPGQFLAFSGATNPHGRTVLAPGESITLLSLGF